MVADGRKVCFDSKCRVISEIIVIFYITFVNSVSFRTRTALNEVYMYDTIYHPWELPLAPALQNTA